MLASNSPRRRELLALLRIPFETADSEFLEQMHADDSPRDCVVAFAQGKALAVANRFPAAVVLGCDTLLSLDGQVVGKPQDVGEARSILSRLQGRSHLVHSAVALARAEQGVFEVVVETVCVWMFPLTGVQLESYVESKEWTDKAGAYAIQGIGGQLIERIEGDFTAVVGLPLRVVTHLLQDQGVALPMNVEDLYQHTPYPNWKKFSSYDSSQTDPF